MSDVPRKILAVKKDPPNGGYRFMVEFDNRSYTFQTDDAEGERIQRELARLMLAEATKGIVGGRVQRVK